MTKDLCLYEYFHYLCIDDVEATINNIVNTYNITIKEAREALLIGKNIYNSIYDKEPLLNIN